MPRSAPAAPPVPLPRSYWLLPGKLLAGEHPGGADAAATRARLARLLIAGVRSFFDLTEPGEAPPYEAELPPGADYSRRPIPDHGIPQHPTDMAELLESLQRALRAEGVVYLHCRAGIGRTGMVAGCLLVERGLAGEEALAELNRCWQGSDRAASWPYVPETFEQSEYVRCWERAAEAGADPLLDPSTLSVARGLRARFLGAFLGLAVGDAVAAATQYRRPGKFPPVGDLIGGGPFDLPRGGWSDDTALALCLADSLLECDGFDTQDQLARYRRWQREGFLSCTGQCLGITAGTARALSLAPGPRPIIAGAPDADALPRVVPVALYYFGAAAAPERAVEAARVTSAAAAVLGACQALARGLGAALSGASKPLILAQARAAEAGAPGTPGAGAAAAGAAPAALAAALDCFARHDNFRDAVLTAANLGGDSDVVAATCGALAGAHYSQDAIPALWRNSLIKRELIESYADRLLAHALCDLGE